MKRFAVFALLLSLLAGAVAARAGELTPGLQEQMRGLADNDELKVLVVMKDRVDIGALDWELHQAKVPRSLRHQRVLESLQAAAERAQADLLADLTSKQGAGGVRGWTPHWIVNGVVVRATVAAIRELAARPDVERIEADLVVELIEPVAQAAAKSDKGIGLCDGVHAVQADRVWRELGVTGVGAIVGNLDTGVDGSHPAFSARWRGHFAPAEQCWLDAADFGDPTPVDHHYHGTHVMGTMTGLAPDDTIGIAPGALWIASNVINQGTGSEFDNDVIASLEWMADPDGNPATLDDVPDVVQNSWGVNEGFSGYYDCDSRWWDAIDGCEAAGVVLTWSAGNEGEDGPMTMRSPADRAASPTNAFSVGSTIRVPPYTISSFSSRGPSGCGGEYATKPEVVAPGSDIYSAQPGGGYQYLSGTSMAGPHVAGVVALMRSANPDVDVITVKEILMATATDLGPAGEENTYGHGLVNAYEAVLAVMGGLGAVEGTVTDASTSLPLAGVLVRDVGGYNTRTTGADGAYSMVLTAGDHTLSFSAFGYLGDSRVFSLAEAETLTLDVALAPAPTATLSGHVYDPEGDPVAGATVTVLDTPLTPAVTDPSGYYEIVMPTGATYEVRARANGLGAEQVTVVFDGDLEQDFHLPILYAEDFESGNFLVFPWEMSGVADWVIDTADPYEGADCAKSGAISHNQETVMSVTLDVVAGGDIKFYYKVSSESGYDYLRFLIDGSEAQSWSGTVAWALATFPVDVGTHTFTWKYTKDGSVSSGSDAAWVDFVEFPTIVPPQYPQMICSPLSFEVTLAPGSSMTRLLSLANHGGAALDFLATVAEAVKSRPVATVGKPAPELPKDAVDTRPGVAAEKGAGGPDEFGYYWKDSDEPGGPSYDWVEINGVGSVVGSGDDSNHGPFDIGFPFQYYGDFYSSVRVCTNGWVSFTSSSTSYTNNPIPNAGDPNNLLAIFWDDLNPNDGGTIYYYQDTANERFIVEWDGVPHYSTSHNGPPVTFEVILNIDGSIVYQYQTTAIVNECTVGIEDAAGADGLQVVFDAAYLHDDLAIRFAAESPVPWLSLDQQIGTVPPGGKLDLHVFFDAADMAAGSYAARILLASNDPSVIAMEIPVTLLVDDLSAAGEGSIPEIMTLETPYPNPFNPQTIIPFRLPQTMRVELRIYDLAGRLVRTLIDGPRAAGPNQILWDGTDARGRSVASGTYYARLIAGEQVQVRPLVLVR